MVQRLVKSLAVVVCATIVFAATTARSDDGEGWISLLGEDWKQHWWESPFNKNAFPARGTRPHLFRMVNGELVTPTEQHQPGHIYYVGRDGKAFFRNFDLKVEARLDEKANAGVYFDARYQKGGWPKNALQIKFNNTHRQRDKTGSLHYIVQVKKSPVKDDEWFELHLTVNRGNVISRINGEILVDWDAPSDKSYFQGGTIALQGHTLGVRFRNLRLKILPD